MEIGEAGGSGVGGKGRGWECGWREKELEMSRKCEKEWGFEKIERVRKTKNGICQ